MKNQKRIFAASIAGETHQFSLRLATEDHFVIHRGDDIKAFHSGGETLWSALFEAADAFDWSIVCPLEAWAGADTGPAEQMIFDKLVSELLRTLSEAAPVDGVFLPLHGALLAEHIADTEGYLLEHIRKIVGDEIPIAVALDPHGNITRQMTDNANILTAFRTTPHVDMYDTGMRAAKLLNRTLNGEIQPRTVLARLPMLDALDRGRTLDPKGPMRTLLAEADKVEADDSGILLISLHAGYAWADFPEAGPSVAVVHDQQEKYAYGIANYFIGEIWRTRDHRSLALLSLPDAMQQAQAHQSHKPLIIAEYTDNPGGGGYGDCTNLLKSMLEAKLENAVFFCIADAQSVQAGVEAGVGSNLELNIGGKMDARFSGEPLNLSGTVTAISDGIYRRKGPFMKGTEGDMGLSLCLSLDGIDIIITSKPTMTDDREQLRLFGITPEQKTIIACKGMNHFRADYEGISSDIIYVDAGGICSLDYQKFPYQHLPRPIWPIDEIQF